MRRGLLILAMLIVIVLIMPAKVQAQTQGVTVGWCVQSSPCPDGEGNGGTGDTGGGRYPPPVEELPFVSLFADYTFVLWIVIAIAGVIIVVWSLPNREIKIWGDKAREIPFLILKRRKKRRRGDE